MVFGTKKQITYVSVTIRHYVEIEIRQDMLPVTICIMLEGFEEVLGRHILELDGPCYSEPAYDFIERIPVVGNSLHDTVTDGLKEVPNCRILAIDEQRKDPCEHTDRSFQLWRVPTVLHHTE